MTRMEWSTPMTMISMEMLIVHQMMMMAMELQMKIQTVGILTAMECQMDGKPPMDSTLHQHLTQMVQTATLTVTD